ncbi:LON peptidase substrate-binding domain-containing protein [Limnobacter litoralis]|uniref:Peptidase S16 n=1 Tax=Limnobacter litoralis TaxID=481366 RepID=A0ABQ5YKF0_9BURK|nr:LON peptidase substrate-binding domain-containing protein [Limnobacter litoralis]GLR25013.1 peptidase S16 [Limnobacter litoralis]
MSDTLSMPLFPLGTVLYPGGALPLQIFEVRYLDLIKRCLREDTEFGVVSLFEGGEIRRPGEQLSLAQYGTLARIENCEAPAPALLRIQTVGTRRFKLHQVTQQKGGLWVGDIELLEVDPPVTIPDDLLHCADKLKEILESLEEQDIPEDQWPFHRPYRFDDCSWVANRWCELLPIEKPVKLQLLSLSNPLLRLELINDQLQEEGLL